MIHDTTHHNTLLRPRTFSYLFQVKRTSFSSSETSCHQISECAVLSDMYIHGKTLDLYHSYTFVPYTFASLETTLCLRHCVARKYNYCIRYIRSHPLLVSNKRFVYQMSNSCPQVYT
ncbi:hypothetical protein KCU85_g326, partial [Aureobasidium melanogenum]